MSEHEPKKISRRETLDLIGLTLLVAGAVAARLYYSENGTEDLETKPVPREKIKPYDSQPDFVSSIEIGKEIDTESFKKIVNELFSLAILAKAGEVYSRGKIPDSNKLAWSMVVPFKKEGTKWANLHLTWGLMETKLMGFQAQNLEGRIISINYINNGEQRAELTVVGFTDEIEPTQYFPAPWEDRENGVVKPISLSASEMARFLKQTIHFFNVRLPLKEGIPRMDKDKVV